MLTAWAWIIIIFPGILYVAQLISSINFKLAQKLGIQEEPDKTDSIVKRAEKYVAYWDLIILVWMPVAGIMMLFGHQRWPIVLLVAGAIYLDTSGREYAKITAFKHEGVRLGSKRQHRFFISTYFLMALLGIGSTAISLAALLPA